MERINLTPKTKIILPVVFQGKSVDLMIETDSVNFEAGFAMITDNLRQIGELYKSECDIEKLEKEKNVICENLTNEFNKICPEFKKLTNGVNITVITVWLSLIAKVTELIQQNRAENLALEQIQTEDSSAVEV